MTGKSIMVYIEGEGGGCGSSERHYRDTQFRVKWRAFLEPLAKAAEEGRAKFRITAGEGGSQAYDRFCNPIPADREALRLLIVDSEGPVRDVSKPWQHLGWKRPPDITDRHCYLIVQCLETWLVADLDALKRYYDGRRQTCFDEGRFPHWQDLEQVPKDTIQRALEAATKECGRRYHHADGNLIIGSIDRTRVRRLPAGNRLFTEAETLIREYCKA